MGDWLYLIGMVLSFRPIVYATSGWWIREGLLAGEKLEGTERGFILLFSLLLAGVWPLTLLLALIMIPTRKIIDLATQDTSNKEQQ